MLYSAGPNNPTANQVICFKILPVKYWDVFFNGPESDLSWEESEYLCTYRENRHHLTRAGSRAGHVLISACEHIPTHTTKGTVLEWASKNYVEG